MRKRGTLPSRAWIAATIALAALAAGCAVPRPTLQSDELAAVRTRYLAAAREDTRVANEKMLRRMHDEQQAFAASLAGAGNAAGVAEDNGALPDRPWFDILILSGGGDYGAFGAGFLKGWGSVTDHELRRPTFDMVTGVSTGALIAPFAFIGDDPSYERLVKLYSSPNKDWFRLRGLLFFLPGNESFLDNAGLRRDLEHNIDAEVVARIAAGSREGRVLAINTTNLDVGAMHPFELSAEAERAEASGDRSRMIDVLLASAAIPAVFPPVIIDGALYVDGGTTSNILYGANWLSPKAPLARWRERHPGAPPPRLRFWIIINNQVTAGPQIVQPTWMSITRASLQTTIRASTVTALRHLFSQTHAMQLEGYQAEFRYTCIPADWVPPSGESFSKEVMESLANLGLKMGADPASWRRDFSD